MKREFKIGDIVYHNGWGYDVFRVGYINKIEGTRIWCNFQTFYHNLPNFNEIKKDGKLGHTFIEDLHLFIRNKNKRIS